MKIIKNLFVFVLLLFVSFYSFNSYSLSDKIYKELSTFSKVLDIVDKMYVKPINDKEVMRGAIGGMLESLDPHTVYLPAEIYKNFSSDTKGRFGGVGIEVSVKEGVLTVISPIQGTPAWEAGIKSGDKIVSIDGESTKNMSLGDAVLKMRGYIGKKITLGIWRHGKTRTVTIVRELIKVPGIKVEDLGEGLAMFQITSFQEGVAKSLKKHIEKYKTEHGELKGMILDLRDNPGGLLTEAVKISDFFIDKGVIVSTKGRNQKAEVKRAHRAGTYNKLPMVVLINGGSASASEIVAGALKDNGRSKLMGTTTFGKGSVQTIVNLDNGDALKITIAYYYTPKNNLIDGKGIDPDIKIDSKIYRKKFNIKEDDEDKKITRDEYLEFQKNEALAYLKKIIR